MGACKLIADSYAAQNQIAKAVNRIREIAAQRPKSALLQNMLGQLLTTLGNRAEARRAFETAAATDASFAPARLALAQMDLSQKQVDSARRYVDSVLASDARNVDALLLAADIEVGAAARPAAIAKYRTALDVDGSNVLALNNLAYLLVMDNPDEALKIAQQAVSLAPESASVQDTIGWVYYRKGMYDMAVRHLQRAVATESTPSRQFHLGASYLKAGARDLGQKTMTAALKRNPNLLTTEQGW